MVGKARVWAALVALALSARVHAQDCQSESQCSFKKPNILLLLDYSSSMTGFEGAPAYFPPGQTVTTRWGAELDATSWILRYGNGFFADNARIALTRFAHDPKPNVPGTTISTDPSFPAITDGFAIDVPFDGTNRQYLECKGSGVEAAVEVLRTTPPPPGALPLDPDKIMLTWTRGGLRAAHALIDRTRANHQSEPGEDQRDYEVVLMTDGDWTCPDMIGQGCQEDPAPEAALLRAAGVPVHVIAFGDATMTPSLREVALQGGTGSSIDATSPQGIVDAFSQVLEGIRDSVIVPSCTQKLPRMLVIMDASTSMLVGNAPGQTKWDKARFALGGNPAAPNPGDMGYVEPVLRHKLMVGGREAAIEDVVHLGLMAFSTADAQELLVGFGPCMRDNLAWAMDPATSCEAPGCKDPYAGAPIHWTFKNSDRDRDPRFVRTTHSYMPPCDGTPGSKSCLGGAPTTFTGQGLEFAHKVISDYKRDSSPFAIDAHTRFVNVLITDGETSQGSSDVPSALRAMVAEGIETYVIGFGSASELDRNQLNQYAAAGNTKTAIVVDPTQASSSAALADALSGVVASLGLDSCCVLNDCAADPEPADPHAVCGDGHVDVGEVCDDGPDNATYGHCGGRCDGPHLYCGDGRIDGPERCDDGDRRSGDGCDEHCRPDDAGTSAEDDAGPGGTMPPLVTSWSGGNAGRAAPQQRTWAPLDAGAPPDAGAASRPAKPSSSGCGCAVLGASRPEPARQLLLAVVATLFASARRRRKQRPSP
jgi:cysteine-rich repeat protein